MKDYILMKTEEKCKCNSFYWQVFLVSYFQLSQVKNFDANSSFDWQEIVRTTVLQNTS